MIRNLLSYKPEEKDDPKGPHPKGPPKDPPKPKK